MWRAWEGGLPRELTSVLNSGNSPRVPIVRVAEENKNEEDAGKKSLPAERDERDSCPSHMQSMQLLSMAVFPEERCAFRHHFWDASRDEDGRCCKFVSHSDHCRREGLRMGTVPSAFGGRHVPESRTESEFLNEFFILDVKLNRAPLLAVTGDNKKVGKDSGKSTKVDYDTVCPVISYEPGHQGPEMEYLYQAAILFLPQCGIFYCHWEHCRGNVGVKGTLTAAYNMSWCCLHREVSSPQMTCVVSYTFG